MTGTGVYGRQDCRSEGEPRVASTTQAPELKRYHPIREFAWLTLSVAGGYTGGYAIPLMF